MTDTSSLTQWLQTRHCAWNTPTSVIQEYVRKATGQSIAHASRLILGQDNEVHDVVTTGDERLIVRISHKENHRFEAERWALHAAHQAGVPTPRVFLVEQASYDDTTVMFCIEEKLPGKSLDMLLQEGAAPNHAIDQIGEVLGRLHSVKVEGFGFLRPDGTGSLASFADVMLELNGRVLELEVAAKRWGVPASTVATSLDILNAHSDLYAFSPAALIHGDFGPQHILVDGDHISGLVDMQDCSGNHPIIDLVNWDAYYSEQIPLSRVRASYGNPRLFQENFDTLFQLALLRESLIMLMVNAQRENPNGIHGFIINMERALSSFGHMSKKVMQKG